jgi:hypothetical protein
MSLDTCCKNISSVQLAKEKTSGDAKSKLQRLSVDSASSDVSCDTVILASNLCEHKKSSFKSNGLAQRSQRTKLKMGITHYNSTLNGKLRSTSSSGGSTSSVNTIVIVRNKNAQHQTNVNKSSSAKKEIWIDGPHEKMTRKLTNPNLILTPPEVIKDTKEIWIDGPNADLKSNENAYNKEMISSFFDTFKERIELAHNNSTSTSNINKNDKALPKNKSESSESLECLDQQLLRQLNEHDMDAIDTVFKLDSNSRPISLLSVNSYDASSASISTSNSATTFTNTDQEILGNDLNKNSTSNNLTFKQKLEDLKASTDQMVFRQSCKQMESLHKTLESFLNLDQSSKMTMMMKPIKSTVLAAAYDLKMNLNGKKNELKEDAGLLALNTKNECILKGRTSYTLIF